MVRHKDGSACFSNFKLVVTLSTIHFLLTYLFAVYSLKSGKTQYTEIPFTSVLPIALLNLLGLVCVNMSLATNSLGVYQLVKMGNVPFVVAITWLFWNKKYSSPVLASLTLMTFGIALAVGGTVSFNIQGALFAIGGIVTSVLGRL
jgi:solute carrier family 35 protein E3